MADSKNGEGYIIGGRRYTPDKSAVLCQVKGIVETETLYQTQKGAFFKVRESEGQETTVDVLDKDSALDFMDAHPASIDPEAYARAFGEPQEG